MNNLKLFKICRFNPHKNTVPYLQIFSLSKTDWQPMMLDNLFFIQHKLDNSLSFRRSCREGICGSCAMNINGMNTLACIYKMQPSVHTYLIYPLSHLPILKDLVVSLKHFYLQYQSIEPWIQSAHSSKSFFRTYNYGDSSILPHQTKQHKLERNLLDGLYECILCACCSTSCPSYWWNTDSYLGPAILLQAFRWIIDSRDHNTNKRLQNLNDTFKLYRCHTIMNCTATCPKNLNPAEAISNIKRMISSSLKLNKHIEMIRADAIVSRNLNQSKAFYFNLEDKINSYFYHANKKTN